MTLSRAVWGIIRDNPNVTWTPKALVFESMKRDIYVTYENAKKILQRYARRGLLERISRGQYIFSGERDTLSHSRGQKGTKLRGMSHLSGDSSTLKKSAYKCDKGTCHNSPGGISLFKRMVAVCTNENLRHRAVSPGDFIDGPYLMHIGDPETKRRYFYRLEKLGVFKKIRRGKYKVNVDIAREIMEGTPLGVQNVTTPWEGDRLITVSHHFRIKKAIPLTQEELEKISQYLWSKDPIKDYVNGVYLEAYPTGEGDRSHGVRIITPGAIFHVTYSYKKNLAKVMIYPKGKEGWTYYASALFGEDFTKRAIRIGISSHFGFNLDEVTKVLWEGDRIKVTINRSDFGSSGDLEFEGVSEEGAEYVKKRILGEVESIAREVDILESLRSAIAELSAHIYMLEQENTSEHLQELRKEIEEIKEHVEEHSKALTLILRSINIWKASGEVEGYA